MHFAPPDKSLRRAIVAGLLCLGAIAAPVAFGATHVWAYCSLQMLVASATLVWGFSAGVGWRQWLFPLVVLLAGASQLVPLSASMSEMLAPETLSWRIVVQRESDGTRTGAGSIHPARTVEALRRCLMLALVVSISADLAGSERHRKWLVGSIAGAGVTILLLGILVDYGPERNALGLYNRDGYWKFYKNPLLSGFEGIGVGYADVVTVAEIKYVSLAQIVGNAVGAMINPNHFAVCVGMTLPVVLGLLISLRSFIKTIHRHAWMTIAARTCVCVTVAYVCVAVYAIVNKAHARAGVASLVAMTMTLAAFKFCRSARQRQLVIATLLVAALGVVLVALRFIDAGTLGGRHNSWSAAIRMFLDSPILGVGLGNYTTLYPRQQADTIASFAHSAWLELPAETGLLGLAIAAIALGYGIRSVTVYWNSPVSATRTAVRMGILGGLLFAAIHGMFDFSVQIPANAYLCALLAGILLGDVSSTRAPIEARRGTAGWKTAINTLVAASFAGLLCYGGVREIAADCWIKPLRRAIAMQRVPGQLVKLDEKPELIMAALPDAIRAFELKPHDASIADTLGQAYLHLSRGKEGDDLDRAEEWLQYSLRLCPSNPWTSDTLIDIRLKSLPADYHQ